MKFFGRGTSLALAMLAGVATAACYSDKTSPTAPTTGDTTHTGGTKPDTSKCTVSCPIGTSDTSRANPTNTWNEPQVNRQVLDTKLGGITAADYFNGTAAFRNGTPVQIRSVNATAGFNDQAQTVNLPISGSGIGLLSLGTGQLVTQSGQQACAPMALSSNTVGTPFVVSAGQDAISCNYSPDTTTIFGTTPTGWFRINKSNGSTRQLIMGAYNIRWIAMSRSGALGAFLGLENNNSPSIVDSAGARYSLPFANTPGFIPTDPGSQVTLNDSLLASVNGKTAYLYRINRSQKQYTLLCKFGLGVNGTSADISPDGSRVAIGTVDGSVETIDPYHTDPNAAGSVCALKWSQALPDRTPVLRMFYTDNNHNFAVMSSGKVFFNERLTGSSADIVLDSLRTMYDFSVIAKASAEVAMGVDVSPDRFSVRADAKAKLNVGANLRFGALRVNPRVSGRIHFGATIGSATTIP